MTYRERFGSYEVRVDGVVYQWFKSLEKAQACYDEFMDALDEIDDAVELVNIKTGEVIARAEAEVEDAEVEVETVMDIIVKHELPAMEERLEKLIQMNAPQIIIDGQRKAVEEMKIRKVKIGGSVEKLEDVAGNYEIKKGKGGKSYILFENGTMYFPAAKYGRYIK